jgi:anti-anti-sigma factor
VIGAGSNTGVLGLPEAEFSTHSDEVETVLVARGEIDMATVDELRRGLRRLVESAGERNVVVDLADVTFIDSSGLEALVRAEPRGTASRLVLRSASPAVRRLLEVTGTTDRFVLE